MKKAVDGKQRWVNPDGTPTLYFLELIQNLSANGLTEPVANIAPVNGEVLTYDGTAKQWEPA